MGGTAEVVVAVAVVAALVIAATAVVVATAVLSHLVKMSLTHL